MKPDLIILGRQPILNRKLEIVAYELLFRDNKSQDKAIFKENLYATSRVLVNALNNIGAKNLLGGKPAFINIDDDFISRNLLETLPKEHFVFEILETTRLDDIIIQKISALNEAGYIFALDDFVLNKENVEYFQPIFHLISFLIKSNFKRSCFVSSTLSRYVLCEVYSSINSGTPSVKYFA